MLARHGVFRTCRGALCGPRTPSNHNSSYSIEVLMSIRPPKSYTYEAVPGNFLHDDESKLGSLPAVPPRLGLKDPSETRWLSLFANIRSLNDRDGVLYKLFLLSRHGQGYHNLAEAKYGTEAWDEHWSKLNGDGEITWGPDPLLTELGKSQAHAIQAEWTREVSVGIPQPHRKYCSPLRRALDTCDIIYEGHPGDFLVVENCREENGVHTCDKRSLRSDIQAYKPHFAIKASLTEEDVLWHPTIRETKPEVAERARKVLDFIFKKDTSSDDVFISITAHGGFINGFLTTVGRTPYSLPTGGVIPILVKATPEAI